MLLVFRDHLRATQPDGGAVVKTFPERTVHNIMYITNDN
jgi:hypothetical protein